MSDETEVVALWETALKCPSCKGPTVKNDHHGWWLEHSLDCRLADMLPYQTFDEDDLKTWNHTVESEMAGEILRAMRSAEARHSESEPACLECAGSYLLHGRRGHVYGATIPELHAAMVAAGMIERGTE